VSTALQIARILANDWNPKYAKLFVMDEFEKVDMMYRLVDRGENGITVIDDDACMYHLGNSTYVKDKIKWDDKSNLFLLKNDIPIAKFKVNEKIMPEKIELLNQLDYFGNTLLIYPGHVQDLGHDYTILFDKIYSEVDEKKQAELLKELEKKAPTALFTAKSTKNIVNSVYFFVTSNIEEKSTASKIVIAPESLLEIPRIFNIAKKVHSILRNALLYSFIVQFVFGIIALIFYKYLILLLALNVLLGILSQIIEAIIVKKICYFPSQPANLAHSHHAA